MARILILGAGVFGRLAAEEARTLGHEPVLAHRSSRHVPLDARRAEDVARAVGRTRADAVLHAAGPYQGQAAMAARAASEAGVPYVDISDDAAFSEAVLREGQGSPLLTGMSTTPALSEAVALLALRRAARASTVRCALYAGGGNKPGPATLAFAATARLPGKGDAVDFPGVGRRRAFPARVHVSLPDPDLELRTVVGMSGAAALGWRVPWLVRHASRLGRHLPRFSTDTAGCCVVDVFDDAGRRVSREAVFTPTRGQRMAVLPALWAIDEALAGRAPAAPALPSTWVEPERLLSFLRKHRFERFSAGPGASRGNGRTEAP